MMHRTEHIEFDREDEISEKGLNLFYLGIFIGLFVLIVFIRPSMFSDARWNSNFDLSGDGAFTIADIFQWLLWLFSMPGDAIVQGFMTSKYLASFFELSAKSYAGPASVLMSLCYWWLLGGKKLLRFWIVVILLSMYKFIPSLPLKG